MTSVRRSATLFREGADLDALLAELDEEHDGKVRVVDVTYGRDGGVLGFFAKRRVGVHFAVEDDEPDTVDLAPAEPTRFELSGRADALEELLRAAEQAESRAPARTPDRPSAAAHRAAAAHAVDSGRLPADATGGDSQENVEFARMLIEMATAKASAKASAEAAATPADTTPADTTPLPVAAFVPVTLPPVVATPVTPAPVTPAPVPTPAPARVWTAPPAAPSAPTSPVAPSAPAAPRAPQVWTAPPAPPVAPSAPPVAPTPVAAAPAGRHAAAEQGGRHAVPEPLAVTSVATPAAAPVTGRHAQAVEPRVEQARPEPVRAARGSGSGAHRASPSEEGSRTEYTLRRQLAEAGVPVSWIPERTADAYWIVEELVSRVAGAPTPDLAPGAVLVVAGAGADALATARQLQAELRLPADCVVAAGFEPASPVRRVDQRWEALALVAEVRQRREAPLVVALDTDTADSGWASAMVAAFGPDVLWHVVDATRKPVDARLAAGRLGRRVDALVVVNAARTASPASVWELQTPIAMVDGRRSTPGAWAVLLIDTLAALGG